MKRKTRFQEGGSTGRFDEDLYARARRFVEEQERREGEGLVASEEETPKVARPARAPAPVAPPPVSDTYREEGMGRGRPAPAEIPVDASMRGPAKQFSSAMEMGDTERALATTIGALGGAGRALAGAPRVAAAAQTAKEMGRGMAAPVTRAAKEGLEVAAKSGPRAGLETAQSTFRGMRSRADIQARRTAREKAEAEAMEKAKPILQTSKSNKAERARGPRRVEEGFSKGGSASSRADGCAKRGKTRGKIY